MCVYYDEVPADFMEVGKCKLCPICTDGACFFKGTISNTEADCFHMCIDYEGDLFILCTIIWDKELLKMTLAHLLFIHLPDLSFLP